MQARAQLTDKCSADPCKLGVTSNVPAAIHPRHHSTMMRCCCGVDLRSQRLHCAQPGSSCLALSVSCGKKLAGKAPLLAARRCPSCRASLRRDPCRGVILGASSVLAAPAAPSELASTTARAQFWQKCRTEAPGWPPGISFRKRISLRHVVSIAEQTTPHSIRAFGGTSPRGEL